MRRREEGIGFWLTEAKLARTPRLRLRIPPRFKRAATLIPAREVSLDMAVAVKTESAELASPGIADGLGTLAAINHGSRQMTHAEFKPAGARDFELLASATIGSRTLMLARQAAIHSPALVRTPAVKSPPILGSNIDLKVRATSFLQSQLRIMDGAGGFLSASPSVHSGTPRLACAAHCRRSMEVERLNRQETDGFLREAEILKGIPLDRGELMAVFPHVPVEMIANIRFVESRKELEYTLVAAQKQRRTRVHDTAAVLDKSTNVIHLVSHRTRYRTVFLI